MPSAALTRLAAGSAVLRSLHGESLTRRAASDVMGTEHGEVVTSETGQAILGDNASDEPFTCNWFDEFYMEQSPDGITVAALRPACEVSDDELSDPKRNDIITRVETGVAYSVQAVKPDGFGNNLLLLSKHAH